MAAIAISSLVVLILAAGFGSVPAVTAEQVDLPTPTRAAIIARGDLVDDACLFTDVAPVSFAPPNDSTAKWVAITINADCTATVDRTWLTDASAIDEMADMLNASDVLESGGFDGSALASEICRVSEQLVYMNGFGGDVDKLTTKRGRLQYCWKEPLEDSVRMLSHGNWCAGSNDPWWSWVVDSCVNTNVKSGPAPDFVEHTGRGNYHCDPVNVDPCKWSTPSGFFHRLFDRQRGYVDGSSACTFWWDGVIVAGVNHNIISGCR